MIQYSLSIFCANVLSLGRSEQGFVGKLAYLKEQFRTLHGNFLGVQKLDQRKAPPSPRAFIGSALAHGKADGEWSCG